MCLAGLLNWFAICIVYFGKMSQTNTLFSYFSKSPKSVESARTPGAAQTPNKENVSRSAKKNVGSANRKVRNAKAIDAGTMNGNGEGAYTVGDLVWAKLDGHPWWPSVVCKHPTRDTHYKRASKNGLVAEIHVGFFDEPPSRAWVKKKFVKAFCEDSSGIPKRQDAKWQKAFKDAKAALQLPPDERVSLVACTAASDDDDTKDAEDSVEVDDNVTPQKRKADSTDATGKRRRIVILSDDEDSGDEFKPDAEDQSESEMESDELAAEVDSDDHDVPKKKRFKTVGVKVQSSRKSSQKLHGTKPLCDFSTRKSGSPISVNDKTKTKLSSFASPDSSFAVEGSGNVEGKIWTHLTLDFLKKGHIKDAQMRPDADPDYDPRTLCVPNKFKDSLTPAMRQWWEMKSKHFDVILFFKMGKFYELYHMDAVIGVNELNLIFMKGDNAHAGFPEIAYGRYSASLIEKGYRVARVEQMENPAMMEERCKKTGCGTKFDKVVRREICQITTKGTRRYGFLDAQTKESSPAYLLAVTEKSFEADGGDSEYGVCFIDTSIGKFHLGQFRDDRHGSRLRTLFAHYPPAQVLHEKGALSPKTLQLLKNCVGDAIVDVLVSKREFWNSEKTLKHLAEGGYFTDGRKDAEAFVWPSVLKAMLDEGDCRGLTAKKHFDMAVCALGACTWYLSDCFLDQELLTMKCFDLYKPVDGCCASVETSSVSAFFRGRHNMVLDGIALKNLDILRNNSTGTLEGTLLARLDNCCTLAGKRLLHQWICTPLCNPTVINERLDAISDLLANSSVIAEASDLLKKLPDLERLLSKIHAQGSHLRSRDHPDSRAMFYDDNKYSKQKIVDFLSVLTGFKTAIQVVNVFKKYERSFSSKLLKRCVAVQDGGADSNGLFPNLKELLIYFDDAFDHKKAKEDGKVIPLKGVDNEYDESVNAIRETRHRLDDYLDQQSKHFHCKLAYCTSARNRFHLEVPESAVKYASNKYEFQGQRKGFKRYLTAEIKDLLSRMVCDEEKRDAALRDVMRRIFATFSKDYEKWSQAVKCMATLDVLLSLAHYSRCGSSIICRPEIVMNSENSQPFLEIRNGCHPCISTVFGGGDYIPNDTVIGIPDDNTSDLPGSLVLVTGPNMGGKSTLMRQVGLITIMAQMGCYVPAEKCQLTPVDRIFTRLGASDHIMLGESTFYVELSETASVLRHASRHSLILMDELGRGTSTYDGVAIAHSVVNELAHRVCCRTLFSTHYHSLVEQFSHDSSCNLGHMACLVENENEDDPTQETIAFLYKFIAGACPKSYGFNAAKLAGIPEDVVRTGHRKAKELETMNESIDVFRKLNRTTNDTKGRIMDLIAAIRLH